MGIPPAAPCGLSLWLICPGPSGTQELLPRGQSGGRHWVPSPTGANGCATLCLVKWDRGFPRPRVGGPRPRGRDCPPALPLADLSLLPVSNLERVGLGKPHLLPHSPEGRLWLTYFQNLFLAVASGQSVPLGCVAGKESRAGVRGRADTATWVTGGNADEGPPSRGGGRTGCKPAPSHLS